MIAKCPTCEARYRVDDSKVSPGGTKFKCKKCKNTFTVFREFQQQEEETTLRRAPTTKNCPHCGKPIPFQAIKCRFCRQTVDSAAVGAGVEGQEEASQEEEHQDPFAPRGGPDADHQDPFAPEGGPDADHQDPFVPQGAGGYSGFDAFESDDDDFGPGRGGQSAPGEDYPGAGAMTPMTSVAIGRPITGKKISPSLFTFSLWGGVCAIIGGAILAQAGSRAFGVLLSFAGNIGVIFATIYGLVALYRVWYVIPNAYSRTTPGKAVGFMFIPLFNFYWVFVAVKGLADDARGFLSRAGVGEEKISPGLSLAYSIMFILSWVPLVGIVYLIIETILIYHWASFNDYVLDNPGQFAQLHDGTERNTDSTILFILVGLIFGLAIIGILAAILIPAYLGFTAR